MRRTVDALLGVLYIALAVAVVAVGVLVYQKAFTDFTTVTLRASSLGNALQKGSDVKVRGVPVGTVEKVVGAPYGADVTLRLNPDQADKIPAATTARLLPKTLFGARYVALSIPSGGPSLSTGDVVLQDTSVEAVEVEQVFDSLLPLLTAVQPEKISATLSEISTALRGQGESIGDTLQETGAYLARLNPDVPQFADDLDQLAVVARNYSDALPDLLSSFDDFTTTSATLVDQREQLSTVYATVASAGDTTRGFLTANEDTIVVVARDGRKALSVVAPYSTTFPCTFKALKDFIPVMDRTLGAGTSEPGLHATLTVLPKRAPYVPGTDDVTYGKSDAACPYFPGSGQPVPGAGGAAAAFDPTLVTPARTATAGARGGVDGDGLGRANSPAENQLVAELVAPGLGQSPAAFPRWGSLLLGPTLRGKTVEVS